MKLRNGIFALLVFCLLVPPGFGQEFRATISGHVLDATGAAVPTAKVQAVNVATNETTTALTDNSGAYSIPFLRAGNYKLTVTAKGFKEFVRENIVLEVGKVAGIDVKLEVGEVTQTVEVTAQAELLETQTASRGGVVNEKQVAELPLNARNPFMLGAMMPGVTFNGAAIWQRPFDNGAIAEWSVNGSRDSSAEFMMDGASNDGQMGSNNIAYVPIVDAVQEFNVMMNTYNAEYGHTGGGIMNVVLKSGTSQMHGSAWEFMRRTPLDANTFQNNATGTPKPTHYLDQYGFQIGGPLFFPKLLTKDGKVKLFYSGSFENYREGTPNPLIDSYPTQEMRNGDFSKLVNANGQKVTIYNPFDYTLDNKGNPVRQPFPNNVIPASMINPIAQAVTKYMPMPNRASPPGSRYGSNNLFLPDYFDKDKFYNLSLKFDWNFGDRHRAFFRHASNDRTENRSVNGIDNKPGTDGQQPFQRINDAYVADWVGTMSPTFILNARASFNRFIEKGYGAANAGFDLGSLGLPQSLLSTLPGPLYFGRWDFPGYNSLGRYQSDNYTNTYEAIFSATKIQGAHTLKAGLDMRQINYEQQNQPNILYFKSTAGFTQQIWNQGDAVSGDSYASFLLGIPGGSSGYPLFPWWKQMYVAPYIQDDWKVNRKLTLNLGLRLDLNYPVHEKWNRMNGPFDPNAASPLAQMIDPKFFSTYPQLQNLKGSLTFAGVGGIPSTPANLNASNWQPRFGFAYQLRNRLVMRGGIGLYYSNPNNDYFQTAGFSTSTSLVDSLDGGRTPVANVLSNPYPNGIKYPTGSSLGALTFVGQNSGWFDSNFKTPRVWSFSYGFQYQVNEASTVEVSYVGSRSSDLNMQKDYNLPGADFHKQCDLQLGGSPDYCNAQVPNPFKGLAPFAGTSFYTSNTLSRYQMARPFPQFDGNLTQYGRNDSSIYYNSLQATYRMRFKGGLDLIGDYTWSKQVEQWGFNDPYNNVYQQGLYFLDRPQVFKLTAIYDLPFGRGKHFLSGTGGFVNKLVSGWELNSILTAGSGLPANLPSNVIQLKDPVKTKGGGWNGQTNWNSYAVQGWNPCVLRQFDDGHVAPTPTSVADGCGTDPSSYPWLETADYAVRYTPYRSGQIRNDPEFFMDASVIKATRITERVNTEFGFEAFNALNHNYFGRYGFNNDPNSPNFGIIFPSQVSTQTGLPRQIQVRFKVIW